jgi:DNA-binding NarL/FixJ family response regulator
MIARSAPYPLKTMSYKIFVVDDHPVMRRGYSYLIGAEMDMEICGEAESARAALEQMGEASPDLALVDLTLKGMGGLELIKRLQAQYPDVRVLVVSMHDETLYADRALRAGARGYIMKDEVESAIVKAIRRILDGGVYVSDALSTKILLQYTGAVPGKGESPLDRLSDRELEVFESMGRGYGTREIAERLALSPKTIDSYRSRIKDKLAIDRNSELTRRAVIWVESQDQKDMG